MKAIAFVAAVVLTAVSSAPAFALSDRFNITAQEHAACDGDAERLCMSAYPSEDRMVSCMQANRSNLTPVCLTTFDAGIKRRHLKT